MTLLRVISALNILNFMLEDTFLISADAAVSISFSWRILCSYAHWTFLARHDLCNNNPRTIGQYFLYQPYPDIDILHVQPLLLAQRFMLNLRQSNKSEQVLSTDSRARHFSRFSISFRMPSNLLGDIGEPLDHGQSERRLYEGDEPDNASVADGAREWPSFVVESPSTNGERSGNESENHDEDMMAIREVARDALDLEMLWEKEREVSSSLRTS